MRMALLAAGSVLIGAVVAQQMRPAPQEPHYTCSFCGTQYTHTDRMVAGPNHVFICSDCVALCNDVFASKDQDSKG